LPQCKRLGRNGERAAARLARRTLRSLGTARDPEHVRMRSGSWPYDGCIPKRQLEGGRGPVRARTRNVCPVASTARPEEMAREGASSPPAASGGGDSGTKDLGGKRRRQWAASTSGLSNRAGRGDQVSQGTPAAAFPPSELRRNWLQHVRGRKTRLLEDGFPRGGGASRMVSLMVSRRSRRGAGLREARFR